MTASEFIAAMQVFDAQFGSATHQREFVHRLLAGDVRDAHGLVTPELYIERVRARAQGGTK